MPCLFVFSDLGELKRLVLNRTWPSVIASQRTFISLSLIKLLKLNRLLEKSYGRWSEDLDVFIMIYIFCSFHSLEISPSFLPTFSFFSTPSLLLPERQPRSVNNLLHPAGLPIPVGFINLGSTGMAVVDRTSWSQIELSAKVPVSNYFYWTEVHLTSELNYCRTSVFG